MARRRPRRAVTHPALEDIDPWTALLWRPRTISVLALGIGALLVYCPGLLAPAPRTAGQPDTNTRNGVCAAVSLFLAYSTVQGPDTVLVRPHPAFWRLCHGVSVLYACFLAFLLFQTPDGARLFMQHLSPGLGATLSERTYGEDCRPQYSNIRAMVLDEFVVAHTVGWWAKALMLRHSGMLWVASVLFEVSELTFQHLLPNFNECWWDRWLLDVLICNNLGIVTGLWTVRYFKARRFNWLGLSKQPTLRAKVKRVAGQLLPWSYESFDWQLTSGPTRCLLCVVPLLVMTSCELNAFFLKRVLWIPPRNALNTCRLCIWVGMACPAMKEYYEFVCSPPHAKLGAFAWLSLACFALETLLVIKVGDGMFAAPWPPAVRASWGVGLTLACSSWALWALCASRQRTSKQKKI